MGVVKTHTFSGQLYKVEEVNRIDGVTDTFDLPDSPEMMILAGTDLKAFHSAMHEGMEASGMCDNCLHGYEEIDSRLPRTWDVARFLWRLGYKRTKK